MPRALVLIEHGSRHCPASHRDSTTFVHAGSACNESSLCASGSSSIQSWRRNGIHLRRDATCECRQPGDSHRFRARPRRGALSVPPRGLQPRETFESFPSLPALRNDCAYEELTFLPDLLRHYRPTEFDVTLTCGFPFTNWVLRRPALYGSRPAHIFVTQNGDWPAYAGNSEYRFFGCDGLVCTNPDFFDRNKERWRCRLIPNGVDCDRFRPGTDRRQEFGLPADRLVVLMVSALIPSKRVDIGIEAVSRIPDAHLVVAGDGPLRATIDAKAAQLLPGRLTRLSGRARPDACPLSIRRRIPASFHRGGLRKRVCRGDGVRPSGGCPRLQSVALDRRQR